MMSVLLLIVQVVLPFQTLINNLQQVTVLKGSRHPFFIRQLFIDGLL